MAFNSDIYTGNNPAACNNRSSPFNNVAGQISSTSYQSRLVSDNVARIIKASFSQLTSPDFQQAYDPTPTKAINTGISDNIDTSSLYTVKQLNKSGIVTGVGKSVRWVPSSYNSDTSDSEASLFIKVTSSNPYISPYNGTTFNQSNALDAGVIFNQDSIDGQILTTAWGSSVKSVLNISNVYEFALGIDEDYTGGTIDATGVLTEITVRNSSGGAIIASGYIFRLENDSGTRIVTVQLFTDVPVPNGSELRSTQTTGGLPCFKYVITSNTKLTVNGTEFKRIEFNDRNEAKTSFDNAASTPIDRNIYQWRWDSINDGGEAAQAEGVFYAWVSTQKALYIKQCDNNNPFAVKYGPVYQDDVSGAASIVWGNEGFNTNTNFVEKAGRFVNIRHSETNDYSSTKELIEGENLLQTTSRDVSYDSAYNYIVGEKVFQIQEANTNNDPDSSVDFQYSSGTVVSWTYPDLTNPSDSTPMILTVRTDKYGPDQPGAYTSTSNPYAELNTFTVGGLPENAVSDYAFDGKILPYRVLIGASQTWPYEVNDSNAFFTDDRETRGAEAATPLSSTIGTTRIRAVTPYAGTAEGETGPLYKFFIFDTELTEASSSFKNVSKLVYKTEVDAATTRKEIAIVAPYSGKKKTTQTFSGTNQTIDVYDTVVYEPSKDKNIFKLPVGSVFENVLSGDSISIEIQKIFNTTFRDSESSIVIESDSGSSSLSDATFLTADANINWFVVNTDTGVQYTLTTTAATVDGQLNYSIDEAGDLVLSRPVTTTSAEDITVFAKMEATFNEETIKEKTTYSKTETLTGLTLETTGKHKGRYTLELSPSGIFKNLNSIYVVTSEGQPITGSSKLNEFFKIDVGVTDQKIVKPKLVLNPGYSNSDGTLKGEIFATPDVSVPSESISLEIAYEYYGYNSVDTPGISTRESFKDSSGTKSSIQNIPFYLSPNDGLLYHESSIIDFRPNSLTLANDFNLGNTKLIPHPDWSDTIDVSFYLPRKDKLILTSRGNFEVLYGTPSLAPVYPQDKPQAMTLYLLDKADYVFGTSDVKFKMTENRRYTMRDIGRIDNRVKKLEYYTTLSLLEKSAEDLLVLDANGNDRFKSGILVDTFNGHRIGDVLHPDYNIAMDFNAGYARPPFKTHSTKLVADDAPSTTFIKVGDNGIDSETDRGDFRDNILMFPYTREVFVAQPLATRSISVQPHEVITFEGIANIWPPMSNWVDTETRPAIRVNLAGENDAWNQMVSSFNNNNLAPFGTQWNEWQTLSSTGVSSTTSEEISRSLLGRGDYRNTLPSGTPDIETGIAFNNQTGQGRFLWRDFAITTSTTTTVEQELDQQRTGFINALSTSTSDVSLGDRIVDVSIQPYMRESILKIWGTGLKPQAKMYVFFDGVNVAEYCYKYESLDDLHQDVAGEIPIPFHFSTSDISNLKTNEFGSAFIEFRLPSGTFRTGDRKFEITDDSRNDRNKASSYASGVYSASGLRTVTEETIATTRNFETTRTELPSQQRTIENTSVTTTVDTSILRENYDPLAQTFFVDPALYPEGIFLESVDLYFARKPTANIPIHIQVKPVINGYPDSRKVYPGGIVFKQRNEVNVSDAPVATLDTSKTRFAFSRPLHLPPGEHCIMVKSPSSEYEVYIATLGDFLLGTESRVTNQPYVGVFFTSANASTWSADQNTDMMMVLNKCVFVPNQVYDIEMENEETEESVVYESINLIGSYVDFPSCRTQWEFIGVPISTSVFPPVVIEPNENKELSVSCSYGADINKTARISVSASTTNRDVCPVVDLDVMDLFTIQNMVESNSTSSNGETNPYATSNQQGTIARARYISRVVTLSDGFESNNLKCILTINKPENTNIQVFAKIQEAYTGGEFHAGAYTKMTANVDNFDTYYTNNPNEYVEVEFDLPTDTSSAYNRFCVKICMYSTNTAVTPKIKDMRAMAVL